MMANPVPLLLLLLSASSLVQSKITLQEQLFDWLEDGSMRTNVETFSFNPVLSAPACVAAFIDGPAWHHHKIQVEFAADQNDPNKDELIKCMNKATKWKAVVMGNDYMPKTLLSSVGWRGELTNVWEAQVTLKSANLLPSPPPSPPAAPPTPPPTPPLPPGVTPEEQAAQDYYADYTAADYDAAEYSDLPDYVEPGDYGKNYDSYDFNNPDNNDDPEDEADYSDVPTNGTESDGNCWLTYLKTVYNTEAVDPAASQAAMSTLANCIKQAPARPKGKKANQANKKKRGILGVFANLRRQLGLQPFRRGPAVVNIDNPYAGFEAKPTTTFRLDNRKLYEVPDNACKVGFRNKYFKSDRLTPDTEPNTLTGTREYDSCFLTQTVVYISYDGNCSKLYNNATQPELTITAAYTPYTSCSSTWLVKMARVLDTLLWAVGIPVGVVVLFIAGPSIWRMVSRPFVYLFVALLPGKSKLDLKMKRWYRMDVDSPVRWKWARACSASACFAPLLALRKRIVYACVSITTVNGHSRTLQVMILAMCTVSVSLMVWKPLTDIVLNSNPSTIALKLNDSVSGPLRKMVVYFQIVGISMFYGVLGYMSSIANINKPGTRYWTTQRVISILAMLYLCAILIMQIINIAAYLPMMKQSEAYTWIVAVQCLNIVVGLTMQILTITRLNKQHATGADATAVVRVTSKDPESLSVAKKQKASSDASSDSSEEEEEPKWWQKLLTALKESVGEESVEVPHADGTVSHISTFTYPSWFLAAVLVALYTLVFHFIKSLIWAERIGNCIITPDLCEYDQVKKWANFFSSSQLEMVNAAYLQIRDSITSLDPIKPVINALLIQRGTSLDKLLKMFSNVGDFLNPKGNKFYRWKNVFGERFIYISKAAFSLGFIVGLITLFRVFMAYKATMKSSRTMRLLQRLKNAADASESAKEDTSSKKQDNGVSPANALATLAAAEGVAAETKRGTVQIEVDGTQTNGEGLRQRKNKDKKKDKKKDEKKGGLLACFGKKDKPEEEEDEWVVKFKAYEEHKKKRASAKAEREEETYNSFKPESLAAVRAMVTPIAPVMYFIGVLLSSTVVQLYAVGALLSIILAVLTHPAFWTEVAARLWPYLVIALVVILFNKLIIQAWIANRFVSSNGETIRRPAGWFAFMIIMSITNLVLGLFIAISRLVILLFTTIFSIGMLDRTILSVRARMDLPYNCFLAGIRLQTCMTALDQPHYRPGPKGRAVRRWIAAKDAILELGPDGYALVEHQVQERAAAAAAKGSPKSDAAPPTEAKSTMV